MGAAPGRIRAAPKADASAVAWLLTLSRAQVTVIIDNTRVWRHLRGIQLGRNVKCVHHADWGQVGGRIHRLRPVHSVKAHLDEERQRRQQLGGEPKRWHDLNVGADALAAGGAGMHTHDPGLVAKPHWMLHSARMDWRYFLHVGAEVRAQKPQSLRRADGAGEAARPKTHRARSALANIGHGNARLSTGEAHNAAHVAAGRHAKGKGKRY